MNKRTAEAPRPADRRLPRQLANWLLTAGLLAAVVLQAHVSWDDYVGPTLRRAWSLRQLPATERTAIMLLGEDTARFLAFVRETVPEDGRIILPPRLYGTPFEHIGMMQYFLLPRDIHNCGPEEVEACVQRATGENTFILALNYFPPRELASLTRQLIAFDENRGVFAPP